VRQGIADGLLVLIQGAGHNGSSGGMGRS